MSDDKDSRVGRIGATSRAKAVQETEAITGVDSVKEIGKVDAVKAILGASNVDAVGRVVTRAERAEIMKMIVEEADNFFEESQIPKSRRKVIKDAVMMAIDAGLVVEEDEES
jgi:superfamily II DNA/RNA helicase